MTIKKNPQFLSGLRSRVSHAVLTEPAPDKNELEQCYHAAFRAPDHAYLRPWRFIEVQGDKRIALGDVMASALVKDNPGIDASAITKAQKGPLRAPLVVVAYARIQEHPKVPDWEQLIAAGCATQNLISAAYAQGYGAVWRTGPLANSASFAKSLGLSDTDKVIGFIYIGTAVNEDKQVQTLAIDEFVTEFKSVSS